MPIILPPDDAQATSVPGNLLVVGTYATAEEGFDHGLVALAAGHPYWLVPYEWRYLLLVEPGEPEWVRDQLELYDRESIGWPPPEAVPETKQRRLDFVTPLVWAMGVMVVYWCQMRWPGRLESAGDLDTEAVFGRHEWWRIVTALFLHADLGHLVSNLVSGIFAFSVVAGLIGRLRGWCLLALASACGNLAIAAVSYPGPYRSLGASTAIFAGLGLLSGKAARDATRLRHARSWRTMLAAIAASLALLGLYGVGGLHVDVGAHAAGLLAGLFWGFVAGSSPANSLPAVREPSPAPPGVER
ncbi:MAG TPA: rhomboid family intramembrane serine protease [Opitutaceae bacterium]|jgi:membrane associated rhomboid family serine protease